MSDNGNFPSFILLADDDADDRTFFADALKEIGLKNLKFKSVPGGEELMQYLKTADVLPDLLFLDLNMPKKNGLECLDEIRKHSRLKDLCIIIYSTSIQFNDILDTLNGGANLYFTKPSLFADLVSRLKKVLALDWNQVEAATTIDKYIVTDGMGF